MTANPSTTWGRLVIESLVAGGVDTFVIAPGSRSTPLVVAAHRHPEAQTYSILDERAAAFFALGYAKAEGTPAAVLCTSGTAGANMHPAVIEADRSRTPLLVCTADRPTALREAGANQTITQHDLFGDAVRWAPDVPEPDGGERAAAALQTTARLAVQRSLAPVPGPVHLNLPFPKPLGPAEPDPEWEPPSVPSPMGTGEANLRPTRETVDALVDQLVEAERPLLVAGPTGPRTSLAGLPDLAASLEVPLLADPLSGIRFAKHGDGHPLGGYDAYLDPAIVGSRPAPDVVLRFGARPTSVNLREYLARHAPHHVAVDPAGAYHDPQFSTTELVPANASAVIQAIDDAAPSVAPDASWTTWFGELERGYWHFVEDGDPRLPPEAAVVSRTMAAAPEGATVFVSNSMPIRELDRFGEPRDARLTVLGNRGASGIDGITSTAIGAASVTDGPAILLTGDLAFFHDMTGLLSLERCGVDLTMIVINNDGGGIFHMLPIEDVDPPFTEHFRTPHGLEFERIAAVYDLPYEQVDAEAFDPTEIALDSSRVVEVTVDAEANHRSREAFQDAFRDRGPHPI